MLIVAAEATTKTVAAEAAAVVANRTRSSRDNSEKRAEYHHQKRREKAAEATRTTTTKWRPIALRVSATALILLSNSLFLLLLLTLSLHPIELMTIAHSLVVNYLHELTWRRATGVQFDAVSATTLLLSFSSLYYYYYHLFPALLLHLLLLQHFLLLLLFDRKKQRVRESSSGGGGSSNLVEPLCSSSLDALAPFSSLSSPSFEVVSQSISEEVAVAVDSYIPLNSRQSLVICKYDALPNASALSVPSGAQSLIMLINTDRLLSFVQTLSLQSLVVVPLSFSTHLKPHKTLKSF